MNFLLISPRLIVQKRDYLGSGVPYWPIELATFTAFLEQNKRETQVLDLFGLSPTTLMDNGDHYLQGLSLNDAIKKREITSPSTVLIYAISYMSHEEILSLVKLTKKIFPTTPIGILENSQAVTGYAIDQCKESFFSAGADALICGEPYWNWPDLENALLNRAATPDNMLTPQKDKDIQRLFKKDVSLPFPSWKHFPLKNYWSLPYAHGPKTKTYLPILTSRGCPWSCDFCVIPGTNNKRWRGRTAKEVVAEILHLRDSLGVYDFQIEDVNPTVLWPRIEELCNLLIESNSNIRFYIVSGTKAETIPINGVSLLARAGCRYISISPESGSPDLMRKIGKRFDYDHGLSLIAECHKNNICTQACFLVGHPEESSDDFLKTKSFLKNIVQMGVTEVAIFIVSPFAGSSLAKKNLVDITSSTSISSFTPKGRKDYAEIETRRRELIRIFFIEKLKIGIDIWIQGLRSLFGTPRTKMENLPRRVLFIQTRIFLLRLKTLLSRGRN